MTMDNEQIVRPAPRSSPSRSRTTGGPSPTCTQLGVIDNLGEALVH
jgi:hypothetical protein